MSSERRGDPWDTTSAAFIVTTITLGFVAIIGFIGNGYVVATITVLRRRGNKSSVQLFLLHLAISDLMVCLICVPVTIFSNFHYASEYSSSDNGLCKIARFVQYLSPTISIALLATISIDRYLSLARPMASIARRPRIFNAPWMIFLAWIYSIVQFLPTFHFTSVRPITFEGNRTWYYCTTVPNNTQSGLAYLMFLSVASFVLPLTTISLLYYKVSNVVWRRQRNLSISSATSGITANLNVLVRSRKRVTRVLLIVVLVFLICWAPFVIYCGFLERELRSFPNPMDGIRLLTYGLGLANSMCNPFIYFFNVGGNKADGVRNLYLEMFAGKRRSSSSGSQRGERRMSTNASQHVPPKKMEKTKNISRTSTNATNLGDESVRVQNVEGFWQPFTVWPLFEDLRESDL